MDYDVRRMNIEEKFVNVFNGKWFTKELKGTCYYSYSIYRVDDTLRSTDISDFFPITVFEFVEFEYLSDRYHISPEKLGGHNISFELFYELIDEFNKWR